MNEYTVTVEPIAWEKGKEQQYDITVTAETLMTALEETLYDYGEDYWILAVDFAPEPWQGEFALTDTRGFANDIYATKAEAIAHGDTGLQVLIAVPHLSR